jgi:arginine decarboxylase
MLNRIPNQYFIVSGSGESNYEIHAGSYHMALYEAGIHNYNILTYSSVLPATATEIKITDNIIPFGSELYTIMSCIHGNQNEYIACGLAFGDLYDYNNKIGSIVCEVTNKDENINIHTQLSNAITDLHIKTYSKYQLKNIQYFSNKLKPKLKYGSTLISICFYNYN